MERGILCQHDTSIAKSIILYINKQLKNESSVAQLWYGIKNYFNDAGQQLGRELRNWITLFQLTLIILTTLPVS
jgi:hypothetical protein